jgi:hypothetical protein
VENDPRLEWLVNDFLLYFDDWKNSVNTRNGDFSKQDVAKMQLSHQTLKGLTITAKSIVSCVKYMLSIGADFVLTRTFNQDKLEQYFGLLRMRGGANDNPNVQAAGHMINQMRFIRTNQFENIRGNVRANIQRNIDVNPLPRRPRQH